MNENNTIKTDRPVSVNPELTIDTYGTKRWYIGCVLHRTSGPAVEFSNGDKYWFQDNKLHREDGPAVEYRNGCTSWHLYGEYYNKKDFKDKVSHMGLGKELFTL